MSRTKMSRLCGLLAFTLTTLPFAVATIMRAVTSGYVYQGGDQAVIELATRRALGLRQLLGPYDHFGWSHPGPAYFYLLSIPYRIFGPGARPELVGELLIFGFSAVAIVGLVYRKAGGPAALWTATWVLFFCLILSPLRLQYPWNPLAVLLPMILVVALAGAAMAGSALSLLAAMVVGSFAVQTDISTFPLSASVVMLGGVCLLARRLAGKRAPAGLLATSQTRASGDSSEPRAGAGDKRRLRQRRTLAGAGIVVLIAMWAPPLIQQLDGPGAGNLGVIWHFFAHGSSSHVSLPAAAYSVAAVDSILLFGAGAVLGQSIHTPAAGAVLAFAVVIGLTAVGVGWRRRQWLGVSLGAISLLGLVASLVAVTRIVGGLSGYLIIWEAAVPLAGLIGLGVAVLAPRVPAVAELGVTGMSLDRRSSRGRNGANRLIQSAAGAVTGLAALALSAALLTQVVNVASPPGNLGGGEVALAWHLVAPHVGVPASTVLVNMGPPDSPQYFVGAGLVDRLDSLGFRAMVPAGWSVQFGDAEVIRGIPQSTIVLAGPSAPAPAGYAFAGYVDRATAIYLPLINRRTTPHRVRAEL